VKLHILLNVSNLFFVRAIWFFLILFSYVIISENTKKWYLSLNFVVYIKYFIKSKTKIIVEL